MVSATRVMLVDDQEMIRAGLRTILGAHPGIEVVAEAGDGLGVLRQLETVLPDVLLTDIRMPGIDGVEATWRIRLTRPAEILRILVLATFDQDENVLAALRAGADGFLSKGAGPRELTDAVLQVASAAGRCPQARSARSSTTWSTSGVIPVDPVLAARSTELTPREREVSRPSSPAWTTPRSPSASRSRRSRSRPKRTGRWPRWALGTGHSWSPWRSVPESRRGSRALSRCQRSRLSRARARSHAPPGRLVPARPGRPGRSRHP